MKFWLSGAGGLLGSALGDAAGAFGHEILPFQRSRLDWRDPGANAALLAQADGFIHTACNTNVEQCERMPQDCYRDNTLLTEVLAQAAARSGRVFVFISSTGVYGDGQSEPHHEYDECRPATHHHRSKWLAEQAVLRYCPDALIIRTGWLFGGQPENPKNFVMRRIEEARAAGVQPVQSNQQQRGNPSYVRDVAQRLFTLLKMEQGGVFNCVGAQSASRFEYVEAVLRLAGCGNPVLPATASHFNRLARVPDNEAALNWRAGLLGLEPMPDWRVSLEHYLRAELALPGSLHGTD